MVNSKLKIKLYGEEFKLKTVNIPADLIDKFMEIAQQLNEPLNVALLNPSFYKKINNPTIKSIHNLVTKELGGLLNNSQSQIEIWFLNKRKAKFTAQQLFQQQTLFPLFQTTQHHIDIASFSTGYYIEERSIGLIGQYEIKADEFQIDDLNFKLFNLQKNDTLMEFLDSMRYKNKKIKLIKSDSLVRYQWCFEIK